MKVITIDDPAYQNLIDKIDKIAEYVAKREDSREVRDTDIWLDSQEVANLLRISTKTLQRLRKEKLINYTILRGRCIYRLSDIEKGLIDRIITCDSSTLDEFRKNYLLGNGLK